MNLPNPNEVLEAFLSMDKEWVVKNTAQPVLQTVEWARKGDKAYKLNRKGAKNVSLSKGLSGLWMSQSSVN